MMQKKISDQPLVVLLVDDDTLLALHEQAVLRLNGFSCDHAANIAEARQKLRCADYALVVLDHHLPDGLGSDLLGWIQEAGINVPVLYSTAADPDEWSSIRYWPVVCDVLRKPFIAKDLITKVRQNIRGSFAKA